VCLRDDGFKSLSCFPLQQNFLFFLWLLNIHLKQYLHDCIVILMQTQDLFNCSSKNCLTSATALSDLICNYRVGEYILGIIFNICHKIKCYMGTQFLRCSNLLNNFSIIQAIIMIRVTDDVTKKLSLIFVELDIRGSVHCSRILTVKNLTIYNSVSNVLLFLILNEAQNVSGEPPPMIRSLNLHTQPLFLHKWKIVWCAVVGRCHVAYVTWQYPTTAKPEAACAVLGSWLWAVCRPK